MPRNKKKTVVRFLKRNTLNIAIILVIVLVIAAIFAVAVLVVDLSRPAQPAQTQQPEQSTQPVQTQQPEQPDELRPADSVGMEDEITPPFDGCMEFLADDRLILTYDDTKLKFISSASGLFSLVGLDEEETPRMDLQRLSTSLGELETSELERLAIGILQAYYYVAPQTEQITVQNASRSAEAYTAELSAPAYDSAPAVTAKIRMMQLDKQFWYAIALMPEGADTAAVEQAFDNLTVQ